MRGLDLCRDHSVTVPLIPVFMVLVGWATKHHTDRQLNTLQRLSGHFLDVLAGLPTLKVFGRSEAQMETIRNVAERYRRTTMATLRVVFLSALVLELLASVAVALVAVSVGLRLLYGHVDLQTALFVLVLAPEAFLPLRHVGSNYHVKAEGLSAAEKVFEILDEPGLASSGKPTSRPSRRRNRRPGAPSQVPRPGPQCTRRTLVRDRTRRSSGHHRPKRLRKSTLLSVFLGFLAPCAGRVLVGTSSRSAGR